MFGAFVAGAANFIKNDVGVASAKKLIGKVGIGNLATGVITGGMAVSQYGDERASGKGVLSSATTAVVDNSLPFLMGFGAYAVGAAVINAPGMALSGAEKINTMARGLAEQGRNVPFGNTTFVDSEQAYTMRQAGMQLAQRSKYNVQQSMLGNEARGLHR